MASSWGAVPPRNDAFIGREQLLDAIHEALAAAESTVVLHGAEGVGKSQIAIEYAYRYATEYELVWWMPAGYALKPGQPVARAVEPDEACLLILDNASRPEEVAPFVSAGRAHVLVTSENSRWPWVTVEVGAFTRSESRQLLRQRSDFDADRLAAALGDIPLAVAACAAEDSMTANDYLRLFEQRLAVLRDPVAAALALSVDLLRARDPRAYELLRAGAFLAPEPFSYGHPALSTSDFEPFRQHRLMRKAVRDQLTEAELAESRHLAHRTLARADQSDDNSRAAFKLRVKGDFRTSLNLAEHTYIRSGDDDLAAADDYALSLRLCGEAEAAQRLDEATWRRKADLLGPDHPQALATSASLAADAMARGKWIEALRMQQRVHYRYTADFGPWHPSTFIATKNLAVAQRRAGDLTGALPLAQAAFEGLVSCYGEDQLDAMSAAMNVSVNLRQLGRLEEARQLGVHVHSRYGKVLGSRHPFTLAAATNLAVTLHALGELSAARGLNEKAIKGMRAQLGQDHPFTLVCAMNLANDLARGGRYDLARDRGAVTLDKARRALSEDHPWTLAVATNLALDMRGVGQLDESAELQQNTLTRLSHTLGPYHPMTFGAYDNLRAFGDIDAPGI
jgi:hypothetical protein